jgi:hypothetical protein
MRSRLAGLDRFYPASPPPCYAGALSGCGRMPGGGPTPQGIPTRQRPRRAPRSSTRPTCTRDRRRCARFLATIFPRAPTCTFIFRARSMPRRLIRDAGEDGLCVDKIALSFAKPPCRGNLIPAARLSRQHRPANQLLYDKLIDSLSCAALCPRRAGANTISSLPSFDRIGGLKDHHGRVGGRSGEPRRRAEQQYLELMDTPPFSHAAKSRTRSAGTRSWRRPTRRHSPSSASNCWTTGCATRWLPTANEVRAGRNGRKQLEHCGTAQAAPGCQVEVRYIYQVLRDFAPEQVFAQTLLGFETVQASMDAKDDTWVGINLVRPEDDFVSMRDYTLQMKMVGYLHSVYPGCTSRCTRASWRRAWCRRRGCASTFARRWSWATRSASATAST